MAVEELWFIIRTYDVITGFCGPHTGNCNNHSPSLLGVFTPSFADGLFENEWFKQLITYYV